MIETSDHAQGGELEAFRAKEVRLKELNGKKFVITDTSVKAPYVYDYKKGEEKLSVIDEREKPRDILFESKLIGSLTDIYKLSRVLKNPIAE
ncbi:MAG TPA: hypothetical protein VF318_03950 [Dehalococcoidales bacterium]